MAVCEHILFCVTGSVLQTTRSLLPLSEFNALQTN